MTRADIEVRLEEIRKQAIVERDYEAAHSLEDILWEDVLRAIADDETSDPKALALGALQTKWIKYPRWCA